MKITKSLYLIWFTLGAFCFIIALFLGYRSYSIYSKELMQARYNAQQETENASEKMDQFILILKPIAESIAKIIEEKKLTKKELESLLQEKKPLEISGLGVTFLPYAFNQETRLYAPYVYENKGENKLTHVENIYNYMDQQYTWFHDTLKKGGRFIEPFYGHTNQTILAEYATPIYRKNPDGKREIIGVATANQSVEHLTHILDTLFLDQRGYWAIVTQAGYFLAHPQDTLVNHRITIFDLAKKLNNPQLAKAGKKITESKEVFIEYKNEITGAPSWLFSSPIKGTNWSIVGVFDKSELPISAQLMRRNLMLPSLALCLSLLLFAIGFLFFFQIFSVTALWSFITFASLILIWQLAWIWYAAYLYPEYHGKKMRIVENKTDLYEYLIKEAIQYRYGQRIGHDEIKKADSDFNVLTEGYKDKHFIPTGIFINNIQFTSATQMQLSAYVWQRYTKGLHDNLPRGFLLPQATELKTIEISRFQDGDTEIILSSIFGTLNQFLHFENYPFDTKSLRIQLWPRFVKEPILLTPDLNAYQLLNPRSLPGIDDDVRIPGWYLMGTNFGYQKVNYSTNFGAYATGQFGIYQTTDKSEIPELYFEIQVSRKLLDTLISDLLPIAVITVLLFVILLTSVQQGYGIIGSLASIFFATVFAQVQFRAKIPQEQVVYFESFYFLIYTMILYILIVTLAHLLKMPLTFIKFKENLLSKLTFWPLLLTALNIISLWYLL